jgi:hypothetical protein
VVAGMALAAAGTALEVTGTAVVGIALVGWHNGGGGGHGGGGNWNGGNWNGGGWHHSGHGGGGELAPRLASVLALDCSGECSRPPPIMAMTTATITRRMPVHPHLRFGIGATLIRATTRTYPNARFRGGKLFSNAWAKPHHSAEA